MAVLGLLPLSVHRGPQPISPNPLDCAERVDDGRPQIVHYLDIEFSSRIEQTSRRSQDLAHRNWFEQRPVEPGPKGCNDPAKFEL